MLTIVKRAVVVGATALSVAYIGGALHLHEKIHDIFEKNRPVEVGYENPKTLSIEKVVNEHGKIEGYVRFSNNGNSVDLPILRGENGLQIGDIDYWWSTLSNYQRDSFVLKGWTNLSKETKTSVVKQEFDNLEYAVKEELTERGWNSLNLEKRAELVTNAWPTLGKETRYALVKSDLEQALNMFYEQKGGGQK